VFRALSVERTKNTEAIGRRPNLPIRFIGQCRFYRSWIELKSNAIASFEKTTGKVWSRRPQMACELVAEATIGDRHAVARRRGRTFKDAAAPWHLVRVVQGRAAIQVAANGR